MADRDVTIICAAADRVAANAKAEALGAGPNNLSVPLATQPGLSDPAQATHWGGSGYMPEDIASALDQSLNPMVKVFPNDDGSAFAEHLLMCDPPLYRIYEAI